MILQQMRDRRESKSLEKSQDIFSLLSHRPHSSICRFISAESAVQLVENVMSSQFSAFDSSADITGLPVQSLTTMSTLHKFFLLCLCLPPCLPLSLLCVSFSVSLFFQLDSRDNNGVSVLILQIFFSLISSQTNTTPPSAFLPLPLYFYLSF